MKRGEVYWLDVKSDVKHVNVGNRPVLIVSNDKCNKNSPVVTVVPLISEKKKSMPTHVITYLGNIRNTILCEHIMPANADEILEQNKICTLSKSTMDKVAIALMKQIGIMEA